MDAADASNYEAARRELFALLDTPALAGIPLLVLANKNDLPGALTASQTIDQLQLKQLKGRETAVYSISAKHQKGLDKVLRWLTAHASSA